MDIQSLSQTVPVEGEVNLVGIDFMGHGDEYLTFCLGDENYGIEILAVKEIRCWENPTLIPNSPDYVKGVINIRGVIIPIIDLRIRFGVGEAVYNPTTVVIILHVENETINCMMGFVVDAVSDVLNAEEEDIKSAPSFGGNVPSELIAGMINMDESVVTLLVTEQLLTLEEISDE